MKKTKNCTIAAMITMLIVAVMISCGNNRHKRIEHKVNPNRVYVCSGGNAKRYHSVEYCQGLSNCSGEILEMTIKEAEDEGKTPCRMCAKQP